MSTAAQEAKAKKLKVKSKFSTRKFNRCPICGRSRSYHGYFDMCRICLRNNAHYGNIPGVKKSSW
jgi:small subunit ribosomal protein S14